ncbi:MAG: AAA family ATPase [Candidatus Saccharibacteria bacterium]
MFDGLVLHPHSQDLLKAYIVQPSHAILLLGAEGIGKGTIGLGMSGRLLSVTTDRLATSPTFRHIIPDEKRTISIESIRKLQQFVRLKTTGTATIRRVILIENADRMTTEAQNAFLKLLEEPPTDTALIMTAAHIHGLLPTIRSRVQTLSIITPPKAQLLEHFKAQPSSRVTQAFFLSGGLPGLMTALLDGDTSHPLVESVVIAKQILQQQLFERLAHIEPLAKQKEQAISLCDALGRIAQAGLQQAADKQDTKRLKQWHRIIKETYQAKNSFEANANTKLVLTNLMLQL